MSSKFWFYLTFQNLANYDDFKKVAISRWAAILIGLVSNVLAAASMFLCSVFLHFNIILAFLVLIFVRAFACFIALTTIRVLRTNPANHT